MQGSRHTATGRCQLGALGAAAAGAANGWPPMTPRRRWRVLATSTTVGQDPITIAITL
jgi:hypothetical protein